MRRASALALIACLPAPGTASAKGGVIFDRFPDVQKVGSPMTFTVMTFRNHEGVHPLVTFRNSKTGEVVRVRTSATDLHGVAHGSVRLPSTGPWGSAVAGADPRDSEPFRVGVGLTQTIPSADAQRAARPRNGRASVWLWLTTAGAIGSALLVLVTRRRGHWGAA